MAETKRGLRPAPPPRRSPKPDPAATPPGERRPPPLFPMALKVGWLLILAGAGILHGAWRGYHYLADPALGMSVWGKAYLAAVIVVEVIIAAFALGLGFLFRAVGKKQQRR